MRIESLALWEAESFSQKLLALLRGRWQPSETLIQSRGREAFRKFYFGRDEDAGDHLAIINDWHLRREWNLNSLTDADRNRAQALSVFTVLTHRRYAHLKTSPLNLQLAVRSPYITDLIYPMVAKTPVLSLQYFLDLHVAYTFNAVRHARHEHADVIISFLYELLFLQQKTAIALLDYAELMTYADTHKGDAWLLNAEVKAIMAADVLFAYLKASVEKTIALVGATYGNVDLDARKNHGARIKALRACLPPGVEGLYYGSFFLGLVGSENLKDLDSYRLGLLHKKGIAELQPHTYVRQGTASSQLRKVFAVLHEQHSKNTALLLVALALLTDRLVQLDPPPFVSDELPTRHVAAELPKRLALAEERITRAIQEAGDVDPEGALGDLFFDRGRLRRNLGRPREALADFEEALKRSSESRAEVLCEIGAASMGLDAQGDTDAVGAFTEAIALAPNMEAAYIGRALTYENLRNFESAAADLDVVISRAREPRKLLEKRGLWRVALGRYADALTDFNAALALGHESVDLLVGRAVALRELGDNAASLAVLMDAVDRHPNAVVLRVHRAISLFAAGNDGAALSDLDHIIGHRPEHHAVRQALIIRAVVRDHAGDVAGAIADMERAIARTRGAAPTELIEGLDEMRSRFRAHGDIK